jgi:hypothetical protein
MWTGSLWVASRPLGTPIGSVTEYYGTSLPQGHLWADGSLINAATFVEAAAVLGANTPDKRGRIAVGRDDMGGTPAGLITFAVSGLDGITLKAIGGAQSIVMDRANLPNVALSHSLTWSGSASWTQGLTTATFSGNATGPLFSDNNDWLRAAVGGSANPGGTGVIGSATSGSVSLPGITPTGSVSVGMLGSVSVSGSIGGSLGSLNGAVAQTAMRNIQPSIICNAIVVAE